MPDRTFVLATIHYWWEVCTRAFWDSVLYFSPEYIWKAVLIFCLGAATTTLLVRIIRSREAFMEHLKANIGIAVGGGLLAWFVVFIAYAISEPFMQHQALSGLLSTSDERERLAVIGRNAAESQIDEVIKQRTLILQQ